MATPFPGRRFGNRSAKQSTGPRSWRGIAVHNRRFVAAGISPLFASSGIYIPVITKAESVDGVLEESQ